MGAPEGAQPHASVKALWVGDIEPARQFVARWPAVLDVTSCDAASCEAQCATRTADGTPQFDAVVIDTTAGMDAAGLVERMEAVAPEIAVVLVVAPQEGHDLATLSRFGVHGCVTKTPDFVHQLVPTIAQSRLRQELMGAFRATTEREARLRSILDAQPAVAGLVDGSGRVVAMNRAGLALLGDPGGMSVIGRPWLDFVRDSDRPAVHTRLLAGDAAAEWVPHGLARADGTLLAVRSRSAFLTLRDGTMALITTEDDAPSAADVDARNRLARRLEHHGAELVRLRDAQRQQAAELRAAHEAADQLRVSLDAARAALDASASAHRIDLEEARAERDRAKATLSAALADVQTLAGAASDLEFALGSARAEAAAARQELADVIAARAAVNTAGAPPGDRQPATPLREAHVAGDGASAGPQSAAPPAALPASGSDASGTGTGRDRRRHERVPGMFDGERLGPLDTPVLIQNLSVGGCFISSYSAPPSQPRFDLRIDLGPQGVVEVTVRIAFVAEAIGYGVSFLGLTDGARRQIEAAVEAGSAVGRPVEHLGRFTPPVQGEAP